MSRINVTNLRSFHAVAEYGGFTAASSRLGIAQPTLTRQVRELEERYGVRLFERSTRQVRMTPIGEKLFEIAGRAFQDLERAERLLNREARATLRVYSVRNEQLVRFIEYLSQRYPNVDLAVAMMPSASVFDGLVGGECDFGLLTLPEQKGNLRHVELGGYPLLAYVNERHALAQNKSISVDDLDGRGVIIGTRRTQTRQTFDREIARRRVKVEILQEIDDFDVIYTMAQAGRGIGIAGATGDIDRRELFALRFADVEMAQNLHLAAPPTSRLPVIVDDLFSFARQVSKTPS